MTPTFLFHKTYSDMAAIGRRGGLAHAHNVRARKTAQPPAAVRVVTVPREETAAEAIALLDRHSPTCVVTNSVRLGDLRRSAADSATGAAQAATQPCGHQQGHHCQGRARRGRGGESQYVIVVSLDGFPAYALRDPPFRCPCCSA